MNGVAGQSPALQSAGVGVIKDRDKLNFDPSQLGWYFALHVPWQTTFNNNDLIASITDATGKTGTAATTARPTYIASGQNSKPIIRFNGTSNYLNFGDVLSITDGMVIYCAFKFNGAGAFYMIATRSDSSANTQFELRRSNTTNAIQTISAVGGVQQAFTSNLFNVTNFNTVFGSINPAGLSSYQVNGVGAGGGSASPTGTFNSQATEKFLIGARKQAAPEYFASMDLGSLFIGNLTMANYATDMQTWLKAQWGTP